jgi:hypothetical protein
LEATDTYLPAVAGFPRVAIFAPTGWPVVEWTFLERFGESQKLDMVRWESDITADQAAARTRDFAHATRDDAIVVVAPTDGEPSLWTREGYEHPGITEAVNTVLRQPDSGWRSRYVWGFSLSGATVTLYLRQPPQSPSPATSTLPASRP